MTTTTTTTTTSASTSTTKLEALGFCGADDSINPRLLVMISNSYPCVEWGVLFRPDKEGLPRYASREWVLRLSSQCIPTNRGAQERYTNATSTATALTTVKPAVRLAAHLCGSHVNNILSSHGDDSAAKDIDDFLNQLYEWGFRRVQINATEVNGVDTTKLREEMSMRSLLRTIRAHPMLEFIVQKNDETQPLWSTLIVIKDRGGEEFPSNVVFLHDESKGTGKEVIGGQWPVDPQLVMTARKTVGFAGGIKPSNVKLVAENARQACEISGGEHFWIDMESGIRTIITNSDGQKKDIFDVNKCYDCIERVCEAGLMNHPSIFG